MPVCVHLILLPLFVKRFKAELSGLGAVIVCRRCLTTLTKRGCVQEFVRAEEAA